MMEILVESALRTLLLGLGVGLALKAARVKNPHVELTAWGMVLAAALLMPGILQLPALPITVTGSQTMPEILRHLDQLVSPQPALSSSSFAEPSASPAGMDWKGAAWIFYLIVASLMLAKLLIGIAGTWRLARRAQLIDEPWTLGHDVRVSDAISVPVSFGAAILVPPNCSSWDEKTRRAVLAHERSHVKRGDFQLLIAAELHRAIFWFSPLAWWLRVHLSKMTEAVSDDAAIKKLGDRSSYAQILVDLAGRARPLPAVVPMARPSTVPGRVERILNDTAIAVPPNGRMKSVIILGIVSSVLLSARLMVTANAEEVPPSAIQDDASLVRSTETALLGAPLSDDKNKELSKTARQWLPRIQAMAANHPDVAKAIQGVARYKLAKIEPGVPVSPDNREAAIVDPRAFDGLVGRYQINKSLIGTVHKDGSHLYMKMGELVDFVFELMPTNDHEFFVKKIRDIRTIDIPDLEDLRLTFITDGKGKATELVIHASGTDNHVKRV